jgi:hypothetical protein
MISSTSTTSNITNIQSLSTSFLNIWLDDPVVMAFHKGHLRFGDYMYQVELEQKANGTYHSSYTNDTTDSTCSTDTTDTNDVTDVTDTTDTNDVIDVTHVSHNINKQPYVKKQREPYISPGIKTIIARNLPRDITVKTIRNFFDKYGPINDVYIPKNMDKTSPYYGTIKGFALIKFLSHTSAANAFTSLYSRLHISHNHIILEFAKQDRD